MSIALRGTLASAFSTASGSSPGSPSAAAAFTTYDDAPTPKTNDVILAYAVTNRDPPYSLANVLTVVQNGPRGTDGLAALLSRQRINAGDTLTSGLTGTDAAWAWAAVTFSGFRASGGGATWDALLPYDAQYWDGSPLASGLHTRVFQQMPVKVNPTLAILTVAYLGPATSGRINLPSGWTALPEVTGGAPGETQRTVAAFYRIIDDCSPVDCTLELEAAGDGARYFATLTLCGLAPTNGTTGAISPTLCTLPAAEPTVAMPAAGTNRGWYSVDFIFLPGRAIAALACPSAANDNYGRLWHIRWSGDYPPVPETPVEILTEGVFGAALLALTPSRQYAFYTLAASPNRLRYRRTDDGGRTWGSEVEVLDGGGLGSALAASKPSDANNAPALVLLADGRLIVNARLLQRDEGTGEWTFLSAIPNTTPPSGSSQTLAASGDTLQRLRDRSVMRPRSSNTLLRARGILDDGTLTSDLRTPLALGVHVNLAALRAAWINERTGLLVTANPRAVGSNGALIPDAVVSPRFFAWRVYKLRADELYELKGIGGEIGINVGDARQWEGPAYLYWDPDNLTPYGPGIHNYSNGVCRLKTDEAGLWWLLRAGPDGGLRFARGRRLADFGTCQWDGKA